MSAPPPSPAATGTTAATGPAATGRRVLIVGCGFLGRQVAHDALLSGHTVWATTRHPERAKRLAAEGLQPVLVDWNDARTLTQLPEADRVLVAVSYDRSSRLDRYQSLVGGFRRLLDALRGDPNICYISTTGVDCSTDGRWIDETSPAHPRREAGRVHLEAEQLLWRHRPKSAWTVLRMAGLYGPGRLPRLADVIAGRTIEAAESSYLNLIHLRDAARAVAAAWQRRDRRLYVVADDRPVRRGEFYREIARRCHARPPRFQPASATFLDGDHAKHRSASNKRVWNRRMKRELVHRLAFPTYREGLTNVLNESRF